MPLADFIAYGGWFQQHVVPDVDTHLHTYLSDASSLGLGSVRERLAG